AAMEHAAGGTGSAPCINAGTYEYAALFRRRWGEEISQGRGWEIGAAGTTAEGEHPARGTVWKWLGGCRAPLWHPGALHPYPRDCRDRCRGNWSVEDEGARREREGCRLDRPRAGRDHSDGYAAMTALPEMTEPAYRSAKRVSRSNSRRGTAT